MKTMKHLNSVIQFEPIALAMICWLANGYEHSKGLG